jgi:hypothetical protein
MACAVAAAGPIEGRPAADVDPGPGPVTLRRNGATSGLPFVARDVARVARRPLSEKPSRC